MLFAGRRGTLQELTNSVLFAFQAHQRPQHGDLQNNENGAHAKDLALETKPEVSPPRLPGEFDNTYKKTGEKNLEGNIFSTNDLEIAARKSCTGTDPFDALGRSST